MANNTSWRSKLHLSLLLATVIVLGYASMKYMARDVPTAEPAIFESNPVPIAVSHPAARTDTPETAATQEHSSLAHTEDDPPQFVLSPPDLGSSFDSAEAPVLRQMSAEDVLSMVANPLFTRSLGTPIDLRNVNLRNVDLEGADLRYTDLRGSDLSGANLKDADLRYSRLMDTQFTGAVLEGADIRQTNIWGIDLSDANLKNLNAGLVYDDDGSVMRVLSVGPADLRRADLRGADLRGFLGMLGMRLDGALYDQRTRLPPAQALDPSASKMTFVKSTTSG